MCHLLLCLFMALVSFNAFSQEEIPEWDVNRLRSEAPRRGWTWQPRESWVTEHLRNGGSFLEITGGVPNRDADKMDLANWDDIKAPEYPVPDRFDWREYSRKGLQPIRNQASCGSCWAFSVVAVIESLIKIHFPDANPDLSEQTLVSSCYSGGSCSGGYFSAFNYTKMPGVPDERQDPYQARNSSCKNGLQPVAKIVGWKYIGKMDGIATTDQIKYAILEYGPVSVGVDGSFGSYGSGIYNACSRGGLNHMVNIEGWDNEGQYWIMRNSWGENWGENGYMRIKWTNAAGQKCNRIGEEAAYAVLDRQSIRETAQKRNWGAEERCKIPGGKC